MKSRQQQNRHQNEQKPTKKPTQSQQQYTNQNRCVFCFSKSQLKIIIKTHPFFPVFFVGGFFCVCFHFFVRFRARVSCPAPKHPLSFRSIPHCLSHPIHMFTPQQKKTPTRNARRTLPKKKQNFVVVRRSSSLHSVSCASFAPSARRWRTWRSGAPCTAGAALAAVRPATVRPPSSSYSSSCRRTTAAAAIITCKCRAPSHSTSTSTSICSTISSTLTTSSNSSTTRNRRHRRHRKRRAFKSKLQNQQTKQTNTYFPPYFRRPAPRPPSRVSDRGSFYFYFLILLLYYCIV